MSLLQDGAGRIGKMIFARQGKKFDYDLKQVRLFLVILNFACYFSNKFSNFNSYSSFDLLVIFLWSWVLG